MVRSALFLLGSPRIERDGAVLGLDTRKALALVAYLAVVRETRTRDALATLLWPEYGHSRARAALRRTLSTLRAAREDGWLVANRESVRLVERDLLEVDLHRFRDKLAECATHGHPKGEVCAVCLPLLTEAVELYRGDFMAGFGLRDSVEFDDWQLYQDESLRGELAGALDLLARAHGARGEWEAAIAHARRRLVLDPLHEHAHVQLMRLYALSGRRAAALKQYRECVRLLRRELGVSPLEETTAVYQTINEGAALPTQETLEEPVRGQYGGSPTAPPPESPLVGRSEEWSALIQAHEAAREGGRVAVLDGEAGIGKTRLAEEFLEYARSLGAGVVAARCFPEQSNLSYGPFFEGLSAAMNEASNAERMKGVPEHHLVEAARLFPELAGAGQPAVPLDTPGARSRFFEGIGEVLLALCGGPSGDQPAGVLFLDDLHWADESSLDLLSYLTRRLAGPRQRPLLVFVAWRSEEARPGRRLGGLLAEMERAGVATHLTLGRLNQDAVQELAQSVAGPQEVLGQRLYEETEGLPLFLSEYLKAISRGALGSGDEVWALPGGVRDLLESRLRSVSETGWQLLTTAAVLGRSFDFDTVREASGRGEWEAVEALDGLVAHGLIEEVREGDEPLYDFGHDKLRALVHEETSLARRRLLHRRVARSLAGRIRGGRGPGPLAARISHHYHMAGRDAEAREYSRLAGDHARSLYANRDALVHYEAALALDHPEAGALHEAMGDLCTILGEYAAALASYESAAALLDDAASLEHKLGNVHARQGNDDLAESHYRAALAAFGASSGTLIQAGEQARLYADWSLLAHRQDRPDKARELAEEALSIAEDAGDARALARAHNMLGILAARGERRAYALGHLEKSLSLAKDLDDSDARVAALNNLALVHRTDGENERAIELTGEALALCASMGDRHREAALRNNLADLLHASGRGEESMQQLKQAVAIFAEIGEGGEMRPEIWKLSEW